MSSQDPPRIFNGAQRASDFSSGSMPIVADERGFMNAVFGWMAGGLAITGGMAWYFASSGAISLLYNTTGGMSMLGWAVMLAPLAFILAMNFGLQRMSSSTLTLLFVAFSATMGASLSSIFLVYTGSSIMQVFGITAGTFLVMSVIGYTTSTDLSRLGSLLMMAVIGMLIAMVVNWFMASSALDYIISIAGVLIFTGLIAYDTQKLKRIAAGVEYGSEEGRKLALLGATSLYLDFVNLFLFLLRLLGRRN
jgi:FtsH-binding integral membrane protein